MTVSGSATASASAWLRADPRRFDAAVAVATVAVAGALLAGGPGDHDLGAPDLVAGALAFVLLLLRRHRPAPLLVVAVATSIAFAAMWDRASTLLAAVLVLLGTTCVRLERRPAVVLGVAVAGAMYVHGLLVNDRLQPGDLRLLFGPAACAAAVGIADATRSWRRYRETAEAQIRSTVLASEAQARQQVVEERLAIARELHDLLGHSLSVMNVQTGAALHLLRTDPDRAEQALTSAREAGRTVLDELRDLLAVLRDDTGDDTDAGGAPRASLPTVADLPGLVDTMRSAGLGVTASEIGEPRPLAPAVSVAAYRIVQEALTNAAKHGRGDAAVTTEWEDRAVTLTVVNQLPTTGEPPRPGSSGGHGLVGMRERAVVNGGALEAGPDGDGFRVRARLPVASEQRRGSA